jgi:hypothetical protein
VPFVVKPHHGKHSSVAVLANINTWLAYNSWGGRGKYTSPAAARTSFLRPAPDTNPFDEDGGYHQTRAELWILGWLEKEKFSPDVYTDLDFHNGLITGYPKLVVGTHPEYWSIQMYHNLLDFLSSGGSLIYLGGNGIYEVGRYYEDQTGVVFLNGNDNEPRERSYFRNLGMPESSVLGVATSATDVDGSPYVVLQQDHPVFKDTRLKNGDRFGCSGLNTGKGKNGMASAWEVDDTRNGPVPDKLVVLARAEGVPGGEMTFYEHPGGGSVFAVGSIAFGGSLVVDPAIHQIVRNVLTLP